MARWHDTRSSEGELLYSVRACGYYSVWFEDGRWTAKYHASGQPLFDLGKVIGKADGFSEARMLCRDHIDSTNAATAAGE